MTLFEQSGTWRPEDRAAQQVRGLTFEMPPGVPAFRVGLEFDGSRAGVLDLGCEGPDGWVGWSGGERSSVVISEEWSTPGYLPTPVSAGEWHVVLGLHQVPAAGVDYRVVVTRATAADVAAERRAQPAAPPVPERSPGRDLPAVDGMRWLAADFHAHTLHSDGALSIDPFLSRAVQTNLAAVVSDLIEFVPDGGSIVPLVYSEQFAANRQLATNFMKAYMRGVRVYNDAIGKGRDKDKVIEIIARAANVPVAIIRDGFPAGLDPNQRLNKKFLGSVQSFYVEQKLLERPADLDRMVDMSFSDAAIKELGEYR